MNEHIYKQIELTGSSTKSSDDAIRNSPASRRRAIPPLCQDRTLH